MLSLSLFIASGVALVACAVLRSSSIYVLVVSLFLAIGFLAKAFFHLVLDIGLIEPTGNFTDQWESAFNFATSGLLGSATAAFVAGYLPVWPNIPEVSNNKRLSLIVAVALAMLFIAATAVYWLNLQFNILRIGFPVGFDIDPRLYAVLSFIISWGALLGGLTLTLWLIELRGWPYWPLIYIASLLGFMASVTMGSRVQFLLYVLAGVLVIAWRWQSIRRWWPIGLAMGVSVLLLAASLLIVTLDRAYDFVIAPANKIVTAPVTQSQTSGATLPAQLKTESSAPAQTQRKESAPASFSVKIEAVTEPSQLNRVINELQHLIVMRWVGLEGVMTTAGASDRLGIPLLIKGLAENPSAGENGLYQKMSGDQYGKVQYYTFLTLPGPIGVASYSGSYAVIFSFMFLLILGFHIIEWGAAKATRNPATASVCGVSLAYLTVQMGYPRTLFFYTVELALSLMALILFWWTINVLASRLEWKLEPR